MAKTKAAMLLAGGVALGLVASDAAFHTSYEGTVKRVIDGDTVEVLVEVAPGLVQEVDIRERDLDTPEKRRGGRGGAKCEEEIALGKSVTALVRSKLPPGTTVGIANVGLGKYAGRWVGDIRLVVDGRIVDLGDWLIGQGLAVNYDGGKKRKSWCPKDQARLEPTR